MLKVPHDPAILLLGLPKRTENKAYAHNVHSSKAYTQKLKHNIHRIFIIAAFT